MNVMRYGEMDHDSPVRRFVDETDPPLTVPALAFQGVADGINNHALANLAKSVLLIFSF